MAVLILQTNPDGSVSISAVAQVPPELMQDAEQVPDLDAAAEVVKSVLGQDDGSQGGKPGADDEQGQPDAGAQPAAKPPMGQEPDGDEGASMDAGFLRARKGY